MKIGMTGASGLIGSHLVKSLRADHHEFVLLSRNSSPSEHTTDTIVSWSPSDGVESLAQLESLDAFIHLAGRPIDSGRWTTSEKRLLRDSRVQATRRLAEQLAQLSNPPPLFLSASAVGIYGEQGDTIVDEDTPSSGDSFLAELAVEWEDATSPLASSNTRIVHPRFGVVLSSSGGALGKMLPLFRWGLGGRLGRGEQYWSWISLADCIAALKFLLQNDRAEGPYNLAAPEPATIATLTQAIASAVNRPAVIPAPAVLLQLALGQMADELLLCSCRAVPKRLLELGFQFQDEDLAEFLSRECRRRHPRAASS